MNPVPIAILGCLALFAGCAGPVGGGGESSLPGPSPREAAAPQARPSFARARKLSDQIKVGMSQDAVESMFGRPDNAGFQRYGRATPTPWRALVWEYEFQDVQPPKVLSIVFQEVQPGEWRVNHGDWP